MQFVITFFFGLFVISGFSQNFVQSSGVDITENRLPSTPWLTQSKNFQILESKDIHRLPVRTVADLLQYVSGVDLRSRGPFAQADVSIQGSTFEQVLILIDGIPVRDPQTGHHALNLPISLHQIERIEIIKGTAARIFGANALAGAINIITIKPQNGIKIIAQSVWGRDAKLDQQMNSQNVVLQAKMGKIGHSLGMEWLESDGYRYNSTVDQKRMTYLGNYQGKSAWNWMAGGLINSFGANSYYAFPYDSNAFETVQNAFISLQNTRELGKTKVKFSGFFRKNWDDYVLRKQQPNYYRNVHQSENTGWMAQGNRPTSQGVLGFGTEIRREFIQSSNLGTHQRWIQTNFLEQAWSFSKGWRVLAGINAQWASERGWKVYPGLEASKSWEKTSVFANVGRGSRYPTYTDLYYQDRANRGNPNLLPEWATSGELGIRYQNSKITFHSAIFQRNVVDMIDFVRESSSQPWIPQNIGNALFQGIEGRVRIKTELKWKEFCWNQLTLSHQWIGAKYQSNAAFSKYALDHLQQQSIFETDFSLQQKWGMNVIYRRFNRINQAPISVLDLRALFKIGFALKAFAEVNNAFDQSYTLTGNVPMPGRWVSVGFLWKR